jgi:5'-3' exonuclease
VRLHVVDGTFELFRAHFAKRPGHASPSGADLKATVGVAASLIALLHDPVEAPTHVAVAFDNPIRSFRNDLFQGYKSDEGVLPELRAQFDAVEDAARALGVTVWSMREWEADDAMATAAARFRDHVDQVRILTPDKDLGQCLAGSRVVQVDRIRNREIDETALLERRGIKPSSIPDFLALVGDDADGIPGIVGFGEKTASILLGQFLHLEAIPTLPARWPSGVRGALQLSAALQEGFEAALLWRKLATLVTDVPLPETLSDLEFRGIPRASFEAWCASVGAERLLESVRARPGARWAA